MKFHCGISRHQLKSPFLILVAVMVVCHQSCLFRLSVPVDFPRIIFKTCCCTSLGLFILCLLTNMYILRCIFIFEHDKYIDTKFWTACFKFQIIKGTRSVFKKKRLIAIYFDAHYSLWNQNHTHVQLYYRPLNTKKKRNSKVTNLFYVGEPNDF